MRIKYNGRYIETDCESILELKKERATEGIDRELVIVNGFCTKEDYLLSENDSVFFIEKGVLPEEDELEAMTASRLTPDVHRRVKQGKVAIAGLGGLGSNIAVMLARTGVGELLLVDFDVVDPSNLNRQNYKISHLGMKKTDALKEEISQINPFIKIKTKEVLVTALNAGKLFEGYDIVCEAFDNPEAKAVLVNTLLTENKTAYIVSGSGMAGYGSSNVIQTKRKLKRLYLCGDFEQEAAPGNGLMAPRVEICAGHQANMILRLLLGIKEV